MQIRFSNYVISRGGCGEMEIMTWTYYSYTFQLIWRMSLCCWMYLQILEFFKNYVGSSFLFPHFVNF